MPADTEVRTWTIATWLAAGVDDVAELAAGLDPIGADAIALQSVRHHDVEELGAALGMQHVWSLSHYRRTRLLPSSGVGLAVLTPHAVGASADRVVSESTSTWSRRRRIAQVVTVERADHSGYRIGHSVAPTDLFDDPGDGAPFVRVRPSQVDADVSRAVELPAEATLVTASTTTPVAGAANVLAVTFEMPWVSGDFPSV